MNPPAEDRPDGAATDGVPGTDEAVEVEARAAADAEGTAKEKCWSAAGRVDAPENEKAGVDRATGGGAVGAGSTRGVVIAALTGGAIDTEASGAFGEDWGARVTAADPDGWRKAVLDEGSIFARSARSRISEAKAA